MVFVAQSGGSKEPAEPSDPLHPSIQSHPAHKTMQQALGSNVPDMRLPSLLFTAVLLLAIGKRLWDRRLRAAENEPQLEGRPPE